MVYFSRWVAQSFIPDLNSIINFGLLLSPRGITIDDLIVSSRSLLDSLDLLSFTVSAG